MAGADDKTGDGEAFLARWARRKEAQRQATPPAEPDPYVRDLEDRLRRALGTKVSLQVRGAGGRIQVEYHDANELDRLLELFGAS